MSTEFLSLAQKKVHNKRVKLIFSQRHCVKNKRKRTNVIRAALLIHIDIGTERLVYV